MMSKTEEELFIEKASAPSDKHLWCLVRTLKRSGKSSYDLSNMIGVGSTVAHAIWKKYLEMDSPGSDKRPKIITLCGSTRFIETFAVMAYLLEKEGAIVLGLHLLPESYFKEKEAVPDHIAEYENVAEHFDNLHLRKIDISDTIYVLNVDGYIGESTRREIDYAEKIGKPVTYLES